MRRSDWVQGADASFRAGNPFGGLRGRDDTRENCRSRRGLACEHRARGISAGKGPKLFRFKGMSEAIPRMGPIRTTTRIMTRVIRTPRTIPNYAQNYQDPAYDQNYYDSAIPGNTATTATTTTTATRTTITPPPTPRCTTRSTTRTATTTARPGASRSTTAAIRPGTNRSISAVSGIRARSTIAPSAA